MHSRVRELVFPELPQPRFTGQAVWRAMVDRPEGLGSTFAAGTMYMSMAGATRPVLFHLSSPALHLPGSNIASRSHPDEAELPALLRDQLVDYSGFLGVLRESITSPSQVVWRALEVLLAPAPWHRTGAVLIGDAAHTTTPHLASGAGIAIEDAIVLGEELGADAPLSTALDRFMTRRFERCQMVVENSARLGEWERARAGCHPLGLTSRSWALLAEPI